MKNMPGFDQTGPRGEGAKTGKGFGPCGSGSGWRRGFGRRGGMGKCFGLNWPQTKEDQAKNLIDYKKFLEEELNNVSKEEKKLSEEK